MKLAVFDFDSTLMDGETIDILAAEIGLEKEVGTITKAAMDGEVGFYKSLVSRVELLEGVDGDRVNEICEGLPMMPGSKKTIEALRERGYKVVCFSGGFRNATAPMCQRLGIDVEFANFLHTENGILTGKVGGEMMYDDAKGDMLVRIQKLLNVSVENTIVVGDGANDLSMFKHAGTRIAFCAKPILKKEATHCIEEKDLTQVIKIIDSI